MSKGRPDDLRYERALAAHSMPGTLRRSECLLTLRPRSLPAYTDDAARDLRERPRCICRFISAMWRLFVGPRCLVSLECRLHIGRVPDRPPHSARAQDQFVEIFVRPHDSRKLVDSQCPAQATITHRTIGPARSELSGCLPIRPGLARKSGWHASSARRAIWSSSDVQPDTQSQWIT